MKQGFCKQSCSLQIDLAMQHSIKDHRGLQGAVVRGEGGGEIAPFKGFHITFSFCRGNGHGYKGEVINGKHKVPWGNIRRTRKLNTLLKHPGNEHCHKLKQILLIQLQLAWFHVLCEEAIRGAGPPVCFFQPCLMTRGGHSGGTALDRPRLYIYITQCVGGQGYSSQLLSTRVTHLLHPPSSHEVWTCLHFTHFLL